MPGLAQTMDPFDKITAGVKDGKTEIIWTPELVNSFESALAKVNNMVHFLTLPHKSEQLIVMPDATIKSPAIGFTLNVVRENKLMPVIFYSYKLHENQSKWWPCEQEALAVATAIKKCSHYILQSTKPTLILTDSKPVVEAFNLMKAGKFSASSRMSAFLHSANQYKIDIQHISGKFKQNVAPDYLSRNPANCTSKDCQVCKFISETAQCTVSAITVTTIPVLCKGDDNLIVREFTHTGGALPMKFDEYNIASITQDEGLPIGTRKTWSDIQQQDFACAETMKRLKSGQQPNKKGPFSNDIRRYYNACQAKDLLVVSDKIPNTTQTIQRIVIPKDLVPAIVTQMHHREQNHPTIHQLEKLFNRYFFGIHVRQAIEETVNNCILCKSNKFMLPIKQEFQPMSNPSHPGCVFNIDIMKRSGQKLMVCRDLFSSFTTATIVKTEQADCLMKGILNCLSTIRSNGHITVRTDSATGFQALKNNPSLKKLKIDIEVTDPANKNSIATVDNAIKEMEDELCKAAPNASTCNETILAIALKSMNSKIRNRGLSANEIMFSRDNYTQKNISIDDEALAKKQLKIKQENNKYSEDCKFAKSTPPAYNFCKGDTVSFASKKDKTKCRDIFMVTNVFKDKLQVNKIMKYHSTTPKIQAKARLVPITTVFQVSSGKLHGYRCQSNENEIQPLLKKREPEQKWTPYKHDNSSDEDDYAPQLMADQTHQKRCEDPYKDLKIWENNQRVHARESLDSEHLSDNTSMQLADELDSSFRAAAMANSGNYDDDEDEYTWDDFGTPTEPQSPDELNRVQLVDDMYEKARQEIDAIQTDKAQNLDHVLPIPEHLHQKKKKKSLSSKTTTAV